MKSYEVNYEWRLGMKSFEVKYYKYDPVNDLWRYNYNLNISAKELAEFIIDNAFAKDIKIIEVKEICK